MLTEGKTVGGTGSVKEQIGTRIPVGPPAPIPMNPEKRDAYDYTLADFNTCLGCPQCGARKLLNAVSDSTNDYSKGQARACLEVLLHDHECVREEK